MLIIKTLQLIFFLLFLSSCGQEIEHDASAKFSLHNRLFSLIYRTGLSEVDEVYQKRLYTQLLLSDYNNAPARENPFTLMGGGVAQYNAYHRFETYSKAVPTITGLYESWHGNSITNSILKKYIHDKPVQSPISNEYVIANWLNDTQLKTIYKSFFLRNIKSTYKKNHRITHDVKTIDGLMRHDIYQKFMSQYRNQTEMNLFKLSALFIERQLQLLAQTGIDTAARAHHLGILYRAVYDNILFALDGMRDLSASPELYMWFYHFVNNNIKILLIHEPFGLDSLNQLVQGLYNDTQVRAGFSTGGMDALRHFTHELALVKSTERIVVNSNSYFEFLSVMKNLQKDNVAIININDFSRSLSTDKRPIHTLMLDMYDTYSRRKLDPLEWIEIAQNHNIKIDRVVIDITHEPTIASTRLKKIAETLHNKGIKLALHKSGHKWDLLGNDDRSVGLFIRFDDDAALDTRAQNYNPLTFQYYVLSLKASYRDSLILTEEFQRTLNQNANRCLDVINKGNDGVNKEDVQFVFLPTDSIGMRNYFDIPFYTRNSFAFLLPTLTRFSGNNNRLIFGALPEKEHLDFCRALKIFLDSSTTRKDVLEGRTTQLKNVIKQNEHFARARARTLGETARLLEHKRSYFSTIDREIADAFYEVIERTKTRKKNLLEMLD